jgi:chemotaxis protein histidine kinase CheA
MNDKQQLLKQQIEAVRLAYAKELPNKIATIKADWQQFKSQPTEQTLQELRRKIHGLSGSGATFGFEEISRVARTLEGVFNSYGNAPHIEATLAPLFTELESAVNVECPHDDELETGYIQTNDRFVS